MVASNTFTACAYSSLMKAAAAHIKYQLLCSAVLQNGASQHTMLCHTSCDPVSVSQDHSVCTDIYSVQRNNGLEPRRGSTAGVQADPERKAATWQCTAVVHETPDSLWATHTVHITYAKAESSSGTLCCATPRMLAMPIRYGIRHHALHAVHTPRDVARCCNIMICNAV